MHGGRFLAGSGEASRCIGGWIHHSRSAPRGWVVAVMFRSVVVKCEPVIGVAAVTIHDARAAVMCVRYPPRWPMLGTRSAAVRRDLADRPDCRAGVGVGNGARCGACARRSAAGRWPDRLLGGRSSFVSSVSFCQRPTRGQLIQLISCRGTEKLLGAEGRRRERG